MKKHAIEHHQARRDANVALNRDQVGPGKCTQLKPNINNNGTVSGATAVSSIPLTIHLFSDGKIPDASTLNLGPTRDASKPDGEGNTIIYHAVGNEKASNVGIVALRAERGFENPNKLTVFVSLANNDLTPREVDVELVVDGQAASMHSVVVGPATTGEKPEAEEGYRAVGDE